MRPHSANIASFCLQLHSPLICLRVQFVPLDPQVVMGLTCDIDSTQILVHFKNSSAMSFFVNDIVAKTTQYKQAFITGSDSDGSFTCKNSTAAPGSKTVAELNGWTDDPKTWPDLDVQASVCRQHGQDCSSCLAIAFCNYCPLGGHGLFNKGNVYCDNNHIKRDTKCTKSSDCVGPDCDQKKCPAPGNVTGHEYILRRIVGYEQDTSDNTLTVHAVIAKYDEADPT